MDERTVRDEWVRGYALLALRVARRLGGMVIYRGPAAWEREVAAEEEPPAGRLVADAERLLDGLPFGPPRARYLAAQVRALRAVARTLDGTVPPLAEYARETLGVVADPVDESVLGVAHDALDAALPRGSGALADRLRAWEAAHALPEARRADLPGLVRLAVAETRARTGAFVSLPSDERVGVRLVDQAHFLAAGSYDGGSRSTIHINRSLPFNLADLLYVVAHEGHPGHIAESLLKEIHLLERRGWTDQWVRFMLSPSFVVSEGLGLHAQEIVFPGDEARRWLADRVFPSYGIARDGADLAAVHRARNVLWGAWANAALLAAEGRPEAEVAGYLGRWALLDEAGVAAALTSLRAPGMGLYVLGYHHGHRVVGEYLGRGGDRAARVRRLLTEQVLPADLTGGQLTR
ncbi:hypothetical protein [Streptomyces sp. NPDC127098]|uniref:hypothetical protein n=1 Tax=Streptomyces sp. NPDC127098 TaxID=3347137 RepID=UPI00364FFF4C